ncbi:MAG: adenosine-specific kinase [Candidatus Freyarchaeota archaeon]
MEIKTVKIEPPENVQIILGQAHFIKTVEDIYEAMVNSVPNIKFGIAFCESSGECLVRFDGTDDELKDAAARNALKLSCGHSFIIFMRDAYPINVLNAIKRVPEVANIYAATANPIEVIVAESEQGRGILGVIDGYRSKGIEDEEGIKWRKELLRKIGYKR